MHVHQFIFLDNVLQSLTGATKNFYREENTPAHNALGGHAPNQLGFFLLWRANIYNK